MSEGGALVETAELAIGTLGMSEMQRVGRTESNGCVTFCIQARAGLQIECVWRGRRNKMRSERETGWMGMRGEVRECGERRGESG